MIPYIDIPVLRIPIGSFEIPIHAFGVLVALGIVLGVRQVVKRGKQLGLDPLATQAMSTWSIVTGFIISHMFDVIAYQPQLLGENPMALIDPRLGLSSFGGFIGGVSGCVFWCWRNRANLLAYADAGLYGLTTGWLFGRIGCATAHDHPGSQTSFFMGVDFGVHEPGGVRHDLGLYEAIFTLALVIALRLLARRLRRPGFFLAVITLSYGPVRFLLDFLRVADEKYFGLTPGQYGSILVFGFGLFMALRLRATPWPPPAPPPPDAPAALPTPAP